MPPPAPLTPHLVFTKRPTDFATQLQKLKDHGLTVPDEDRALRYLKNISYYRLSGYWPANIDPVTNRFFVGATFDDIVRAYRFDKKLRVLCMEAIERLEIAFRTQIVQHCTHFTGDTNWYENPASFKSTNAYQQGNALKLIETIVGHPTRIFPKGELERAKEKLFIADYYAMYHTPVNPPAWMALEVLSFGTLSKLFELFVDDTTRGQIAAHFQVALSVFESWIKSIGAIRNKFAHHERFWDLDMRSMNMNLVNPAPYWLKNPNSAASSTKVYYALSILNFLMVQVSPRSTFATKVSRIMREHRIIESNWHTQHMGFPVDWEKELMWTVI